MPRGKRYTDDERGLLLQSVAEVAPLDAKAWAKVKSDVHSVMCKRYGTIGAPKRTTRSIRKQYREMIKDTGALPKDQHELAARAQGAIKNGFKERQARATIMFGVRPDSDVHFHQQQRDGNREVEEEEEEEDADVDNNGSDDEDHDGDEDVGDDDSGDDEIHHQHLHSHSHHPHLRHHGEHTSRTGLRDKTLSSMGVIGMVPAASGLNVNLNAVAMHNIDILANHAIGEQHTTTTPGSRSQIAHGGVSDDRGGESAGVRHMNMRRVDVDDDIDIGDVDDDGVGDDDTHSHSHNSHLQQQHQQQQQQQQQHDHQHPENHNRLQPRDVSFNSNASVVTTSSVATRRTARTVGTTISIAGASASGALSVRGGGSRMRWADSASAAGGGGGISSGGEGLLDSSISVSSASRRKRKKSRHTTFYPTESSEVAALRQRVSQLEQHAEEHRRSERRWTAELLGLQTSMMEARNSDQRDRMRELAEMRSFFLSLLGRMARDNGRTTDAQILTARLDETEAQINQRLTKFEQDMRQQNQHISDQSQQSDTSVVANGGVNSSDAIVDGADTATRANEDNAPNNRNANCVIGNSSHGGATPAAAVPE